MLLVTLRVAKGRNCFFCGPDPPSPPYDRRRCFIPAGCDLQSEVVLTLLTPPPLSHHHPPASVLVAQVVAIDSNSNNLKRDGTLLCACMCEHGVCACVCVCLCKMAYKAQTGLLKNEVLVKVKWGSAPLFFVFFPIIPSD